MRFYAKFASTDINTYTHMKRLLSIAFALMLSAPVIQAEIKLKTIQRYPMGYSPELFCTNGLACYYISGNKVLNYVNVDLLKINGAVQDIKILPTGTSFYALYQNRKQESSLVTDNLFGKAILSDLNVPRPNCFCFSADASMILTAGMDGNIHAYSILGNKFKEIKTFDEQSICNVIAISPNKYYVVTSAGNELHIYNYDTAKLRLSISIGEKARKIMFSSDGSMMYVLCDNSTIHCLETVNFSETQLIENLGEALSFDISGDGKYIVVASDNRLSVVNTFSPSRRQVIEIPEGGVKGVTFAKVRSGSERIVYNTSNNMYFSELTGLEANYSKLLKEELSSRMDAWIKQMPGEDLEEYNNRVNESTMKSQSILFQQEIATELARQYFDAPEFELKGYDYSNHILPVSFGGIQQIYLTVPEEELMSFSDSEQLDFHEPIYIINETDEFELVYVEVYNKATGKQYVFDNRDRRSLDFLSINDQYVPLDLIQLSNMQETKLNEIKNAVVNESISNSIISSHTQVNVRTSVSNGNDADGKGIFTFTVSMNYVVDEGFSEIEDYPSGRYRVEESGAATALCEIISKAFAEEFSGYIKSGKKVTVSVNGTADASKIRNALSYDGVYGDFYEYPAYDNGVLFDITVDSKKGIRTNDELAFIRAAGLKEEICKRVNGLEVMDCTFIYNIHVSDSIGAEHRRVSVSFTFPDAF